MTIEVYLETLDKKQKEYVLTLPPETQALYALWTGNMAYYKDKTGGAKFNSTRFVEVMRKLSEE